MIVPDYQLSLAIGKEGQNARLAARLTGWRIDIRSDEAEEVPVAPPIEPMPIDGADRGHAREPRLSGIRPVRGSALDCPTAVRSQLS